MYKLLYIAIGGAAGTLARYGTISAAARFSERFPYGTFTANLIGCLLIGYLQGLFIERWALPPEYKDALTIGFLGGYTTFSAYGWETSRMLQDGQYGLAATNLVASNIAGIVLVMAGFALSRWR